MKRLIMVFGLLGFASFAFANPGFTCHGTYVNSSGGVLVVPDMSASGSGDVSMEFMDNKVPCPSTAIDSKTIKMTCGAGSMDGTVSDDCKTMNVGGLPYELKQ